MKFLPKIKFVDKIPERYGWAVENSCAGRIYYRDYQIYVLRGAYKNRYKEVLVLLHELCHWLFYVFGFKPLHRIHDWLDKYFTIAD